LSARSLQIQYSRTSCPHLEFDIFVGHFVGYFVAACSICVSMPQFDRELAFPLCQRFENLTP